MEGSGTAMKSILILYQSKTGFTKKYAEMIAEELDGTPIDFREGASALLSSWDLVLFGTRMHAGRMDGLSKARKLFQKSGVKHLVFFVTGAMPANDKETLEEMWRQNLTPEEYTSIPHFYLPSGLCYEKMNLPDRLMMRAFVSMMQKKKDKTAKELQMAEIIAHSFDISSKEYLGPLVAYCRNH